MIAQLVRWWLVAVTAKGLRRGIAPIDMLGLLTQTAPHRTPQWRMALLNDAAQRNAQRRVAAGG